MRVAPVGLTVAAGLLVLLAAAPPAAAHRRDFVWSYQWFTPAVGEHEVETWLTYESGDSAWKPQIEYETGITARWGTGVYATFEKEGDGRFRWDSVKWENRYRFGRYAPGRILHAGYVETEVKEGGDVELEFKYLASLYSGGADNYAVNLIAEQKLQGHSATEFQVTAGWHHDLSRAWGVAVEGVANFRDDAWYLGPTLTWEPANNTRWLLGAVAGLSSASNDYLVRSAFEWEIW